ncbi:MAG: hypothetical protein GY953_04180, partial [bacterium]|nr:hypothetical protein [bacterium]
QPYFSDNFSLKLGRVKQAFSGENLHSTSKLLTTERHFVHELKNLKYAGYSYAMEAHVTQEKFCLAAGLYDGTAKSMHVENQDPKVTIAARATVTATEGLDVSANLAMVPLMDNHFDGRAYADSAESNTGIAFGVDASFKKAVGEGHLTVEAEFDTGDNWSLGAKDPSAGDTWED